MTMTLGSNVIVLARELDLAGYFDCPVGFPAEIGQQGLATLDMQLNSDHPAKPVQGTPISGPQHMVIGMLGQQVHDIQGLAQLGQVGVR